MIKEFVELLDRMKAIHEKKNKDYAANSNPFENFERSAELAAWFNNKYDKAFVNLIGVKLARLATLLNSKEKPNNESIEDSFLDLTVYCALWSSYYAKLMQEEKGDSKKETYCMNCKFQPANKHINTIVPSRDTFNDNTIYYFCSEMCRQTFIQQNMR